MPLVGINETSGLLQRKDILFRISTFFEEQSMGEKGVLNTKGDATLIGYFLDVDGKIRVARVWYDAKKNGVAMFIH